MTRSSRIAVGSRSRAYKNSSSRKSDTKFLRDAVYQASVVIRRGHMRSASYIDADEVAWRHKTCSIGPHTGKLPYIILYS